MGVMWRIFINGFVIEVGQFQRRHEEVMFDNRAADTIARFQPLGKEVMDNLTSLKRHRVDAMGAVQLAWKGVRKCGE
jgi:hypothetical protein